MMVKQTGATSTRRRLAAAMARGGAANADWVRKGEVVPMAALADAWALPMAQVEAALGQGEFFAVDIDGSHCVPSEFLQLDATTVAAVCSALRGLYATEERFLWKRRHGALAGTAVLAALQTDPEQALGRVKQLSRAHAVEAVSD